MSPVPGSGIGSVTGSGLGLVPSRPADCAHRRIAASRTERTAARARKVPTPSDAIDGSQLKPRLIFDKLL